MSNYPRVLVVNGEPINSQTATGITMRNLFESWPEDSLTQIYTANIAPDPAICVSNFRLSWRDLKPLHRLFTSRSIENSQNPGRSLPGAHVAPADETRPSGDGRLKIAFKRASSSLLDFASYHIRPEVLRVIEARRPQVVYTMLGSIRVTGLVRAVSTELCLPVVPHFMDDWLSTYSVPGKSTATRHHHTTLKKRVGGIINEAPVCLVIGDAMSAEYTRRFHRNFIPFMNTALIGPEYPTRDASHAGTNITILVYAGGLHLGRGKVLADIASTLDSLRKEGIVGILRLHVPARDRDVAESIAADSVSVECGPSLSPEEVPQALRAADVAVHVESDDSATRAYTRLSVSTKIPQYCAAALPILACGPLELASIEYVRANQCGLVAASADSLRQNIQMMIRSPTTREALARNAWELAKSVHDQRVVHARFREVLLMASHQR